MSAIGPGDWVECFTGLERCVSKPSAVTGQIPRVGGVYQVRYIWTGCWPDGSREDGIALVGIVPLDAAGREGLWPARCFRPIWRGPQSLIETLLQSIPADNQRENA